MERNKRKVIIYRTSWRYEIRDAETYRFIWGYLRKGWALRRIIKEGWELNYIGET